MEEIAETHTSFSCQTVTVEGLAGFSYCALDRFLDAELVRNHETSHLNDLTTPVDSV